MALLVTKLQRIGQERNEHKRITYKLLVERAKQHILFYARGCKKDFCVYTVPVWLPHRPLYDPTKATKYVAEKMRKQGLYVSRLSPNQLYVSWGVVDSVDYDDDGSGNGKARRSATSVVGNNAAAGGGGIGGDDVMLDMLRNSRKSIV